MGGWQSAKWLLLLSFFAALIHWGIGAGKATKISPQPPERKYNNNL